MDRGAGTPKSKFRLWRLALALVVVLAVGSASAYFDLPILVGRTMSTSDAPSLPRGSRPSDLSTRAGPAPSAEPPVRVSIGEVTTQDMPIYLKAIGTVQAYQTVNVRARVDGEIMKILFEEGQDVKEGDPLAIIDPRPYEATLRQWEATCRKDKAQLASTALDLNRSEHLIVTQAVSQQTLDQQRASVEQGRAQVDNDEAQVEFAKVQLSYTTLRAPISGRVGIRQIDRGNIVRASDNTVLVVLTQLQPISVVFTVPAQQAAQNGLKIGKAGVPVTAIGTDSITELDQGSIHLVDNMIDQTTGTIKLKAKFPNANFKLWPGDFVNGRITVDVRRQGVTVPTAAVRHGPKGDYVWVVVDDNRVEGRSIKIEESANGRTLVARGVGSGEWVVTDGQFLLVNGRRVDVAQSDAPRRRRPQTASDLP